MAIYKNEFLLVMTPTIKEMLGAEFNSTVKQWDERLIQRYRDNICYKQYVHD
jgi:hypothetical protein